MWPGVETQEGTAGCGDFAHVGGPGRWGRVVGMWVGAAREEWGRGVVGAQHVVVVAAAARGSGRRVVRSLG